MNEVIPKANNYGVQNRQNEMQKKGHGIFHTLYKKKVLFEDYSKIPFIRFRKSDTPQIKDDDIQQETQ